jgi:hypothetical protein
MVYNLAMQQLTKSILMRAALGGVLALAFEAVALFAIYELGPQMSDVTRRLVSNGIWCLGLLAALQYATWPRTKQYYRRKRGQCLNCGYDLRSSPDRCPECGTVPTLAPNPP